MNRKLSSTFMNDLKQEKGLLYKLLERVKKDHTLMLAIREDYINIYYRGGSLLLLTEGSHGRYSATIDKNFLPEDSVIDLPRTIKNLDDVNAWIRQFPNLKQCMDFKLSGKQNNEREFQQVVFRENNFSSLANETEFFFSDIEYTPKGFRFKFDMIGVEWAAGKRKYGSQCRPVIVEMKYGDNAIDGKAGLVDHLTDISKFLETKNSLNEQVNAQMEQMRELGLIGLVKENMHKIDIGESAKPLVIFVLANSNPRSVKLSKAIGALKEKFGEDGSSPEFELRFFVANFCGYAMHKANLLTLSQFEKVIAALPK